MSDVPVKDAGTHCHPLFYDAETARRRYRPDLQIQLQVALPDPANPAEEPAEEKSQNGGKQEADHKNAHPHGRAALRHGGVDADGASQIFGFLTMFGIWSMEVPSPWAKRPPKPFSR